MELDIDIPFATFYTLDQIQNRLFDVGQLLENTCDVVSMAPKKLGKFVIVRVDQT